MIVVLLASSFPHTLLLQHYAKECCLLLWETHDWTLITVSVSFLSPRSINICSGPDWSSGWLWGIMLLTIGIFLAWGFDINQTQTE